MTPLTSRTQLHILQHPIEATAAKNTARLIKLCLPNTIIWPGESAEDFRDLQAQLASDDRHPAVIYPCEHAHTIHTDNAAPSEHVYSDVLLIDATWRKAYKMWQLNPWLHSKQALKFEGVQSAYHIRSSDIKHALSTLECAYHYLKAAEPSNNVSSLLEVFHKRQSMLSPPQKPHKG